MGWIKHDHSNQMSSGAKSRRIATGSQMIPKQFNGESPLQTLSWYWSHRGIHVLTFVDEADCRLDQGLL